MTGEPSALSGNDQRAGAYLRNVLVVAIVVSPFLATAFAILQLWNMAVRRRDIALSSGPSTISDFNPRTLATGHPRSSGSPPTRSPQANDILTSR